MKKTLVSLFCVLALCLGLLPTAALAAGENAPKNLYVGNQSVKNGDNTTYWTTNDSGELTQSNENGTWNVKYDPTTATLTLKDATIKTTTNNSLGAVIYAESRSSSAVSLTIELEGTNTIVCDSALYGIYVNAEMSNENYGTDASLTITGQGSLDVSGSSYGIWVKSGSGNASLTIKDASVVANTTSQYYSGVVVQSSSFSQNSPALSLAVNGGSLTASGGTSSDGIQFYVGDSDATNAITSLTVSGNAIVDARTGGIKATRVSTVLPTPTPTGENSTGIVFDGAEGTVYGDVTLDEPLTVGEGETLTIPEGATLNGNSNLTNNGTVTIENGGTLTGGDAINNTGTINVENGGKLEGKPTGSGTVVYAPAITTESLPDGTVNQPYTAPLAATGNNITWSAIGLPAGLTLNAATGTISGTPTTAGQSTVTVTAANSAGSIEKNFTLNIKAATVSVTGVALNTDKLDLYTGDSKPLTATVQPADATNKTLSWESSDATVAAVDQSGNVTAMKAGTATITATANDGSGQYATCAVTVTDKTYTLSADKTTLDFGAVYAGDAQPAAQTVTITNTGNQTVTLNPPSAANFQVGALSKTELKPGETATFTVQPKAGLAVGKYEEKLTVSNQNAGEVTLTLNFTVNSVPVTGVTLNKNTLALFAGDSATLAATVTPGNATNKALTWASSNTAVATVDQSGKVTAVAPGTAAITVTTNDGSGKVASCPVTVTAKTYALTIDPAAIGFGTVQTGYTQPAARQITVKNTGNQTLTLTQPTATKYLVGSLSRLTLAPGETATFTVQPKADQPVAVYNETILVVGNGGAGASLNLSFTVNKGAGGSSSGGASSSASSASSAATTETRTLHFDTNGGLAMADVVRGLGAPVELWPYTPVRAGYLFQGWYSDQALTKAVSSVVLTKDTTIYAKWAVDPAATAAQSGSGSGSGSTGSSGSSGKGSGSQGDGTTITVTPAPTASPTPTPEPTATPTPEPTATPEATAEPETDTDTASFPVVPVAAGVIVLVVLVGGIAIYRRFHD